MSSKRKYRCSVCGYATDIYEGTGFFGQHITPVVCNSCHTIQNLTVGGAIARVAPSFGSEMDRLCLDCGSADIHLWDGHTCPRCNGEMKADDDEEFWT
ncbi:MAG: hypothetical protein Q4F34_06640 [Prevotellaceae bacterium]|nr:hypothetical protein [Prevotellaceae bacterium]